jgi:hypothetical protein
MQCQNDLAAKTELDNSAPQFEEKLFLQTTTAGRTLVDFQGQAVYEREALMRWKRSKLHAT